jgi:hypothetical protein
VALIRASASSADGKTDLGGAVPQQERRKPEEIAPRTFAREIMAGTVARIVRLVNQSRSATSVGGGGVARAAPAEGA